MEGHRPVADDGHAAAGRRAHQNELRDAVGVGEAEVEGAQRGHAVTDHRDPRRQPEGAERLGGTVQHLIEAYPGWPRRAVLPGRVEGRDPEAASSRHGHQRAVDHRTPARGVRVWQSQQRAALASLVDSEAVVDLGRLGGLAHHLPP